MIRANLNLWQNKNKTGLYGPVVLDFSIFEISIIMGIKKHFSSLQNNFNLV